MTPYILRPAGREMLLHVPPDDTRAHNMARSLYGRWAPGSEGYYMTPGKAAKWVALFDAGFDARAVRNNYGTRWIYTRDNGNFTLREAMRMARGPVTVEVDI